MSVNIRLKHSNVQDKVPLPGDLVDGELALNTNAASPAAYLKDSTGAIVKIAGAGSVSTPAATEAVAGIAEIATQAEVTAGTDDQRIVTPLKLTTYVAATVPPASEAAQGKIEIATQAETDGGTDDQRAVTPLKLRTSPDASKWSRAGTTISPRTTGDVTAFSPGTAVLPGLTPVGDSDTGLSAPAADTLALSTGGLERLRVSDTGAIGLAGANYGAAGQALISNGPTSTPSWQSLSSPVFGWDHTNDNYGLYLPGSAVRTGALSGTVDIDVQSRLRRCVINDAGVVQYYLDADDSTKKSGDWLRIVETQSLNTAYTGTTVETTNDLLRSGRPAWSAGTFTRGQRVTHNGSLWECLATSTTAEPAAGTVASVLDGTDGQVMIEVPAFSVRYGYVNGVHTREVRLGCSDSLIAQGFQPHPAFIKTDGTYKDAFYIGAYQAHNAAGDILGSVSGADNVVNITRATARSRAAARGTGWHVHSYLEYAAIQTLLVCEYRDHNSQKVVGNGAQEGAVYAVANGLSNARGNRNGNAYTVGGAVTDFMSYRGIENFYGRAWQWVDGFNVYERVVYLTNNQSAFADNTSVGYRMYAQTPGGNSSYQKEIHPFPDVFLPSVVSGASDTSYLGDAMWTSTGWRVAFVGGNSNLGASVGAFVLYLGSDSGHASALLTARAAYAEN